MWRRIVKRILMQRYQILRIDYCERNKETIICDINKEKLPDIKVDLYYMAGIIDYVTDIPILLSSFPGQNML